MKTNHTFNTLLGVFCILVIIAGSMGGYHPTPEQNKFLPQGMPPHPRLYEAIASGKIQLPEAMTNPALAEKMGIDGYNHVKQGPIGPVNALAVVVDFSDKVKTVNASFFDSLIFAAPVSGRGSVRDYFSEVSYGQIDIVTVNLPSGIGWKRAPSTYANYVNSNYCWGSYPNNCQKLAEDIANAIDAVVDFSQYDADNDGWVDNLMLIHAGQGAEWTGSANDIWSHSWNTSYPMLKDGKYVYAYTVMPEYWQSVSSSTSDMTIGVFAHEMGHGFWGLPDLYDYDSAPNDSAGIGMWSLMANGSWNGASVTGGDSPAWPDAFCRILMGVTSATSLSGTYAGMSIPQAYNNPAPGQTVYKLKTSVLAANEYWLIENRQQTTNSYDQYLPGNGLLIWHVDEAKSNNNNECETLPNCNCGSTHYMVALEQADGLKQMEKRTNYGNNGDPYPGVTVNRDFNSSTTPDARSFYSCSNSQIWVNNISNSGASMTADIQVGLPGISIDDVSVTEGNSGPISAVFTVSLNNNGSLSTVNVTAATTDGSATAPTDYAPLTASVTFPPLVTTQTFTVTVIGDTIPEPNETYTVNLTSPSNATISDAQGLGTIIDDDIPGISINDVALSEGNTGTTNFNFTVSLSASSSQVVSVNYASADGSAVAPDDYTAQSSTLTFNPGELSKPVTITVAGDLLDENDEQFFVNLSAPINANLVDNQGIGTIQDDDLPPSASINDVSLTEGNSGTTDAAFTVSLTTPSSFTITINYSTGDGSAIAPGDYLTQTGVLTFAPGTLTQAVNIPVVGELLLEPDEIFYINLSSPVNATISDNQGIATILTDERYGLHLPLIMK